MLDNGVQEYGKNDYFIISEEDKVIAKGNAGDRRIIGFRANVEDAFGEIIPVEVIFYQPTVKEIREFSQEQANVEKQSGNVATALAFANKWFTKMLLFPAVKSEAGIGLSDFLQYYPVVAGDFIGSLFLPHLVSQIQDSESRKRKEETKLFDSFKV